MLIMEEYIPGDCVTTKPFFEADRILTVDEARVAEDCFQGGILRCDDVPGNNCSIGPYCQEGMEGGVDDGQYFHCRSETTPALLRIFQMEIIVLRWVFQTTVVPVGKWCEIKFEYLLTLHPPAIQF
mmetsp:Transcript_9938/g.15274  ORF Transcript_9938/g.15274 Transcript_9938/m.15274 type:complete len:126 (-) Transcript_9938:134-511(-)